MNYLLSPSPPTQRATRSISECRIRSSFQQFNGNKLLIYKHVAMHIVTEYYIESINNKPCVVTYANNKLAEIRELRDESDA